MDLKIIQLKEATEKSLEQVTQAKFEYDQSSYRLQTSKDLLRAMDPKDQEKIHVHETALPELLELHSLAKSRYEEAKVRYETNDRYLQRWLVLQAPK